MNNDKTKSIAFVLTNNKPIGLDAAIEEVIKKEREQKKQNEQNNSKI